MKAKERPTWCGHCDPLSRLIDLGDSARRCPRCHAATQPGGTHHVQMVIRPPRVTAIEMTLGGDR